MAKDYARYANRPRQKKRSRELDVFIVLLIVLFLLIGCYWFYTKKIAPSSSKFFVITKNFFHHQTKNAALVKKPVPAEKPNEPEVHFDFYNQLPTMQVNVSAVNTAIATAPAATNQSGYFLQLAMYDGLNQANEARISLLLAGADADVVRVGNRYRIQQGPFKTLQDAKLVQKKLHKKGIESTVQISSSVK